MMPAGHVFFSYFCQTIAEDVVDWFAKSAPPEQ
jgi:hypothetical protein